MSCVLIGYTPNSKAYHLWDVTTGKVFNSFYVMFVEHLNALPSTLLPGTTVKLSPTAPPSWDASALIPPRPGSVLPPSPIVSPSPPPHPSPSPPISAPAPLFAPMLLPPKQVAKLSCCGCDPSWFCSPHDVCFIHESCLCNGSGKWPPVKPVQSSWVSESREWLAATVPQKTGQVF